MNLCCGTSAHSTSLANGSATVMHRFQTHKVQGCISATFIRCARLRLGTGNEDRPKIDRSEGTGTVL